MSIALEGEVRKRVFELFAKTNETHRKGDDRGTIQLFLEAWDLLPDEKYDYAESWIIVNRILEIAIRIGDFEIIKQWIDKIDYVVPGGYDGGEREYMKGKIAYECGEYDKAREYLSYANKKSQGRCFDERDKKYVTFLAEKR